jgi:glycerophosphoryl diester phosphodiesterase
MEVIGHRGAAGLAPENSIDAIRHAIKHKADMIELDVRVQGGTLVLSHDLVTKSQPYCPLKQALMEVNGKIPLNLDLKEMKTVKMMVKALENYDGEVLFSSFKFNILHEVRRLLPKYDIAILEKWSGVRGVAEASLLKTKRLHMNEKWLWSNFVQSLKTQGYSIYAYTVNEKDRADELASWGVDGIVTDYPNLLKG